MHKALLTSKSQMWQTPRHVLDLVQQVGPIMLDPATTKYNPVGALNYFTPKENGLIKEWSHEGVNFVNPPFKYCANWVRKCVSERVQGKEIIALIPARTDTKYWQEWVFPTADSICFWKGRLKFLDPTEDPENPKVKDAAPMPVALVYWGDQAALFDTVFSSRGRIAHTKLRIF